MNNNSFLLAGTQVVYLQPLNPSKSEVDRSSFKQIPMYHFITHSFVYYCMKRKLGLGIIKTECLSLDHLIDSVDKN